MGAKLTSVLPSVVVPAPSVSQQLSLFPRKVSILYPKRQLSADSLGEVEADDQHRYYIKGDQGPKLVRASEWICTHIAEDVKLGAPTPAIIEMANGDTVFGSRRIAGVADALVTATYLTTQTLGNSGIAAPDLCKILSAIYALDLFLNNDDRHFGNYLTVDDEGTRRLYTYDFSRALFWNGLGNGFPVISSNTRKCGALIRNVHGFDAQGALTTIDMLANLNPTLIDNSVNRMPSDWLPEPSRNDFTSWWRDGRRDVRIEALRKGITDGSLL